MSYSSKIGNSEIEELGSSKITRGFQVTIPKEARKLLKLETGEYIVFSLDTQAKKIFIRSAKLTLKD